MSELTSMMNIGKEMAKKLTPVGIESSENLKRELQNESRQQSKTKRRKEELR